MTAVERMNQAPDGTCVPLAGCHDVYAVRGKKAWYRCDAAKGTCSCCDFLYRRAVSRTACRHLRALGLHLIAEAERDLLEATVQEHFGNPPLEEAAP